MASGDVLARRKSSINPTDLGKMPYGRSRKLSRTASTMNMVRSSSPTSEPGTRRFSRKFSYIPGGNKVGVESSRLPSDSSRSTLAPVLERRRMNLSDVVIWRRLTRTLKQRVADRQSERRTFCWLDRSTSSRSGIDIPEDQMEPTYRMEPGSKLKLRECESLMTKYVAEILGGVSYNAETCRDLSGEMSDEIKRRIKKNELLPPRYKCVVYIVIGEKKDQGVSVSSESAWDKQTDNYVAVNFQNSSLFCVATFFAVYME